MRDDGKPKEEVSGDGRQQTHSSAHAPRVSDEEIRSMVDDAVKRDRLWIVAEFMATTTDEPRWNSAWVAVERLAMTVWHIKGSRLTSYFLREFMPLDTPAKILNLVHEIDMWMAWRLKDRGGHERARRRLELWRARVKRRAGEPPKIHVEPDTPERVLNDYCALALELGLRLKWTKPAWNIMVALPMPMLKGAISGLVDLYEGAGVQGSSTVVTLGALKKQLRAMRFTHPGTTTP